MTSSTTASSSRNSRIQRLRESYPIFRIAGAQAARTGSAIRLDFEFTVGDMRFQPTVALHGLAPHETDRLDSETGRRLVRALAVIESFSYWKAFCSPILEIAPPAPDDNEPRWWQSFWPNAMGEFFYRNGIDVTEAGFLDVRQVRSGPRTASDASATAPGDGGNGDGGNGGARPLVLFSGGKDSLALALMLRADGRTPLDHFLYNPTEEQARLADSLAAGGRIFRVSRKILPELLALNAANHPNGHTPYSAYLAVAAMLVGYLTGNDVVLAGNSRSDDEPNLASYCGQPVNHQWSKTYEFEHALREYRDHWLGDVVPTYSSPFRPLLELQIVASLSTDIDLYLKTASCNRTKGVGWCRSCAKCAWVFLATSAVFGQELALRKFGADLFGDGELAGLYESMAGLAGAKPFECTGTEEEVRVAVRHVGLGSRAGSLPALASCLRDPRVSGARPLGVLLADWGRDDLVPAALRDRVRARLPVRRHDGP